MEEQFTEYSNGNNAIGSSGGYTPDPYVNGLINNLYSVPYNDMAKAKLMRLKQNSTNILNGFTPFPEIYGVPPLTNSPESDALLLDSLQYIFLEPGKSSLDFGLYFSLFEPAFGEFRGRVEEVANESGIAPLAMKSIVGNYFVFAISSQETYNTTLTNSYSPSVFEEQIQQAGASHRFLSQVIQAAGGTSSAQARATEYITKATTAFEKAATVGLTGEKTAEYMKHVKDMANNIRQQAKNLNTNFGNIGSQALSLMESIYSAALGRRVDMADIWQDSRANLTYNFNMELRTISTEDCIYKLRILEPLLVLTMLTVPRNFDFQENSSFSFEAPYLVSMFVPGIVNIEHGAITDLSITIDSQDMSLAQRPRVIRVSFTVVDLYQTMLMLGKKFLNEVPMVSKYIKSLNTVTGISQKTINTLSTLGNGLTKASMSDLSR